MESLSTTQPQRRPVKTSIQLARAAWRVIKLDKELLGISAISAVANAIVFLGSIAAFIVWMFYLGSIKATAGGGEAMSAEINIPTWAYWAWVGVFYLLTCILVNFFNGAITHAALRRFQGEDPTFREALAAARAKAGPLTMFAGLQATVGMVLNILENRLPLAGRIAVWLVGAAWGVATMFALPIIMSTTEKNPIKVVKQSASIFVGIWKESIFVGLSLGILSIVATVLIVFVVLGLFMAAAAMSSIALAVTAGLLLLLAVLAFSVLYNALHTVVMTAAYYYASTGNVPAGFDEELVRAMFRPKKKWLGV